MTVGERIKQRRIELDLTVEDISEKIGKNRATIYRYEKNDIKDMPTNVMESFARALHTTPAYLMGWESDKVPEHASSDDVPTVSDEFMLSQAEKRIITAYRSADEITRAMVLRALNIEETVAQKNG